MSVPLKSPVAVAPPAEAGATASARGVSRLFRPRVGFTVVLAFAFAAVAAVAAVLIASPELRRLASLIGARLRSLVGLE